MLIILIDSSSLSAASRARVHRSLSSSEICTSKIDDITLQREFDVLPRRCHKTGCHFVGSAPIPGDLAFMYAPPAGCEIFYADLSISVIFRGLTRLAKSHRSVLIQSSVEALDLPNPNIKCCKSVMAVLASSTRPPSLDVNFAEFSRCAQLATRIEADCA